MSESAALTVEVVAAGSASYVGAPEVSELSALSELPELPELSGSAVAPASVLSASASIAVDGATSEIFGGGGAADAFVAGFDFRGVVEVVESWVDA
ncbi:MAG: hypothetical protein EBY56_10060, partial [Actinobacteria bacterium]|nr:hypothetical protein [Actinomycetota bacterium]